ncbi:MAG: glutaredoxin family protein [Litorivicinus sp.]
MANEIVLMHTQDCHLCEQAQAMLDHLGAGYRSQDIAASAEWVETYGIRIPVLVMGERELGWPFDIESLDAFLQGAS